MLMPDYNSQAASVPASRTLRESSGDCPVAAVPAGLLTRKAIATLALATC